MLYAFARWLQYLLKIANVIVVVENLVILGLNYFSKQTTVTFISNEIFLFL